MWHGRLSHKCARGSMENKPFGAQVRQWKPKGLLPCEWDELEIKKTFTDALSSLPCIGPETISEVNN